MLSYLHNLEFYPTVVIKVTELSIGLQRKDVGPYYTSINATSYLIGCFPDPTAISHQNLQIPSVLSCDQSASIVSFSLSVSLEHVKAMNDTES